MGRNCVHSLKSSPRIFAYFVVSLEGVWENVLHAFLKVRLLPLKKQNKKPKRPASKCFLTTREAFTASHLLKRWASSCRCLVYVFLNEKWRLERIYSIEYDWVCSFLFIYIHGQTSGSWRKMSFFLSQTKLEVKKREATMNWKVGCLAVYPAFSSFLSFPHWLGAAFLLSLPSTHKALSNQSIGLWLCWCSHWTVDSLIIISI